MCSHEKGLPGVYHMIALYMQGLSFPCKGLQFAHRLTIKAGTLVSK